MSVFYEEKLSFDTPEACEAYRATLRAYMDANAEITISMIISADGLTIEAKYFMRRA